MTFELWRHDDPDGPTYTLRPSESENQTQRMTVEPGSVLMQIIEAPNYEEAAQRQHEILGWEPYKPYRP